MMNHTPSLCVVLAASTGGPSTLVEVLKEMPDIQKSCVMIVQHLEEQLSANLSSWLSEQTGLNIVKAHQRYQPKQGDIVLFTGTHWQMNAMQELESCTASEPKVYFMPSIDLFMCSMVQHWRGEAIGVLLTGMGKDGAQGLLTMRKHGWKTYAQQEEGCRLYGMPKEAANINAACVIQSPTHIGSALYHCMQYNALSYANHCNT